MDIVTGQIFIIIHILFIVLKYVIFLLFSEEEYPVRQPTDRGEVVDF